MKMLVFFVLFSHVNADSPALSLETVSTVYISYLFMLYTHSNHFQVAQIEWCKRAIIVYIIPSKLWMVWLKTKIAILSLELKFIFMDSKNLREIIKRHHFVSPYPVSSFHHFIHCYSLLIIHFGYVDTRHLYKCVYCVFCCMDIW